MNVNFLNPFLDAAYEVILSETKSNVQRGGLALDKEHYITDDITVIISLVGQVEGTIFYSMDKHTAIQLVQRMMGETSNEFDSLAQSGIAELGNVITGQASIRLSQNGYQSTISPPTLLVGRGAMISTLNFPRLIVPLVLDYGKVMIHLALREVPNFQVPTAKIPIPQAPSV